MPTVPHPDDTAPDVSPHAIAAALDGMGQLGQFAALMTHPLVGYASLPARASVPGVDGLSLSDHYLSAFDRHWNDVSAEMGRASRPLFDAQAAAMRDDLAKRLQQHETRQRQALQSQAETDAKALAEDATATNAADTADTAYEPFSPESFGRKVVEPVVNHQLGQNRVSDARAFLDRYRHGMTPDAADALDARVAEAEYANGRHTVFDSYDPDLSPDVRAVLNAKPEDVFATYSPVAAPADVKYSRKRGDRVVEVEVKTDVPIANSGRDGELNITRPDFGPKPKAWIVTPSGRSISYASSTGTGNDTNLYLTLTDHDTNDTVTRVIETPAAGQRLDIDFGSLGRVILVSPKRQGMVSQAVTSFANGTLDAFAKQGVGDRDQMLAFARDPGKMLGDMAMAVPRSIGSGWTTVTTADGRQRFADGVTSSVNKMGGEISNAYRNHYLTSYIFDKAGRLVPTTIDTVATGGESLLAKGGAKAAGSELLEQEVKKDAERTLLEQTGKDAFEQVPKPRTVTLYRVDDTAFAPRIAGDGSIPVVKARSGQERSLFVNFGQPQRAADFALINRGGKATVTAVEVDASLLDELRATAVLDTSEGARLNPHAPLRVDVAKAPDQFGLRTSEHIQKLRDAIKPETVRIVDPKTLRKIRTPN